MSVLCELYLVFNKDLLSVCILYLLYISNDFWYCVTLIILCPIRSGVQLW